MAFIEWNENYNVDIKQFDDQHMALVEMINELHEAMRSGKGKDSVGAIIVRLIEYAAIHFESEEKLFDQYKYPASDSHMKEHRDFTDEVIKFKSDFDNGKLFLSIEIMNFLKDWLIKHILATDKDYALFFKDKGVN